MTHVAEHTGRELRRVGVDVGGTKIAAVVLADSGDELWRARVDTPSGGVLEVVDAVAGLVREAEHVTGPAASIGIGMPGSQSTRTGLWKNAELVGVNGTPLVSLLTRALGRPIAITNDANCLALSEATDGAARGAAVVFAAILGTGVGGGVFVHGRVLDGPNGIAGEWGHSPLPWQDEEERSWPPCYCGSTGCAELFLSGRGLVRTFGAVGGSAPSAERIGELAAVGDARACDAVARYSDRLARALAVVVNLLDPNVIVLGGGLSRIAQLYDSVPPLLEQRAFSDSLDTLLVPAIHGASSGVRGAAMLGASGHPQSGAGAEGGSRE